MGKAFKDIAKISTATIGSRVLGLVRDSATMAYLSIGAVSAAYTFAFTLPNLFRRLLGEGALISALVPVFTKTLKEDGQDAAFAFLNKTLTRTAIALAAIIILGVLICVSTLAFCDATTSERFTLGAQYSIILLPYMLLICVAAVFSAALNVLGSFGVPSVGPMLLNISIIGGLFAGIYAFGSDKVAVGYAMCFAWLIGGAMQAAIPAYWLKKRGWKFSFDLGRCPALTDLSKLFLPALIGAAVIQLNIFVSKILALGISDAALPSLYISSRILEFPLGVFAVAIATVYFPKLSALHSEKNSDAFKTQYSNGLVNTMCITLPATVGIALLSQDIVSLLFQWGKFGIYDVELCAPVLLVSIFGLPAFAMVGFSTRGFHASKDMKSPVVASYWSFGINLVCSLAFMFKFGAVGLAAANVIAATAQAFILNFKLRARYGSFDVRAEIAKIAGACAAMAVLVILGKYAISVLVADVKLAALLSCGAVIPLAAIAYFGILKSLGLKQLDILVDSVMGKIRRHRKH